MSKLCGECCHLEKAEHFGFQCKHCNGTVSISNDACNHFSKRYGICPECGASLFFYEHTDDNDWQLCTCYRCGCLGTPEEFLYNSVFARITASPDMLAEKLVYFKERIFPDDIWGSTVCFRQSFYSKEEAIAATVEELKKVYNGN